MLVLCSILQQIRGHDDIVATKKIYIRINIFARRSFDLNIIKASRIKKGITQEKCAKDIGISVRTLQRYERGEISSLPVVLKMLIYLDIDPRKYNVGL